MREVALTSPVVHGGGLLAPWCLRALCPPGDLWDSGSTISSSKTWAVLKDMGFRSKTKLV